MPADPPLSPKPSNPPAKPASDAAVADNTGPSPAAAPATSSPQPPALLLEVFGGPEAPFTTAARTLKLQTARPLDKHFQQDILDDGCFRTASQHAACSSVKALWVAIPPGPWLPPAHTHSPAEALRTASHPKGRPDLPEQARPQLQQSQQALARAAQLARTVHASGGTFFFEAHPASTAWNDPELQHTLQACGCVLARVPFCAHGLDLHGAWLLASNEPQTSTLGHTCQHPLGTHRVQLLKRKHEPASSRETALHYPASLCQAVLALVKHQVSTGELARLPLQPLPASPSVGPASILRPSICDGAGMHSTADHSSPGSKTSRLQSLRHAWLTWAHSLDLPKRISAHLMQGLPEHPLSENECLQAATMAHACLHPHCHSPECLSIAPDQPFRLQLLQLLATATNDPDEDIVQLMQQGVPTGAFGPLPASKQWPPAADMPDDDLAPPALLHCEGNWKRAEEHPEVLQALLAKEIEGGFVAAFDGSEEDAKARWPAGTAIGKLNIVFSDERDARLVLDSSICNLNARCTLPERMALPSALDVQLSFSPHDPLAIWRALCLDFKAAHKRMRVKASEHGTLLFRVAGLLYFYKVCHFGARFSSYWWGRAAGLITRILHALLQDRPHRAWIYVDDLLSLLWHAQAHEQACLIILLLASINAPMSWKKAQLADSVTWCGWTFDLQVQQVWLASAKLEKLRMQMQALLKHPKCARKSLEACLGLLMWATTLSTYLRPMLAPLYRDLHSGKGTLKSIAPRLWPQFLHALDASAKVVDCPPGLWLQRGSRITAVGARNVACKADIPAVPATHKPTYVRIADPARNEVHLGKDSQSALRWLASCMQFTPRHSLQLPPVLHCICAADAMAQGRQVGIGGWLSTSSAFLWFACTWDVDDVRAVWPFLTKEPQKYIACFEVLAQLALLQCTWRRLRYKHQRFCMPAATDNSPSEAGLNKLFSTSEPIAHFLKLAAQWAHARGIQLMLTHLPGEKNAWADELSRDKLARFTHREHERMHISLADLALPATGTRLVPADAAWPPALQHLVATTA